MGIGSDRSPRSRHPHDDDDHSRLGKHDKDFRESNHGHNRDEEIGYKDNARLGNEPLPRRELQSYRNTNPPSNTIILHGIPVSVTEESVRRHACLQLEKSSTSVFRVYSDLGIVSSLGFVFYKALWAC